ncbi:hypothetical protein LX15_003983 [Streptoalloteichus tenebrarius]|uniref:Uncharacterized protein n=1 Tax=Streptoalloteichus tenebrarius (strain ATCC 17920 / DSM 40477 / JCM 4838 / CBS 697.72 / NBRC 16177 / NCIMB 11028 / NRRL B-12390 / A12253. 1 / ISP 5477) TaxID=1933 RepID=A0ABT1HY27_STRSD|nr:hypothetical protein [Streptoalloteichus tenebrarius]
MLTVLVVMSPGLLLVSRVVSVLLESWASVASSCAGRIGYTDR